MFDNYSGFSILLPNICINKLQLLLVSLNHFDKIAKNWSEDIVNMIITCKCIDYSSACCKWNMTKSIATNHDNFLPWKLIWMNDTKNILTAEIQISKTTNINFSVLMKNGTFKLQYTITITLPEPRNQTFISNKTSFLTSDKAHRKNTHSKYLNIKSSSIYCINLELYCICGFDNVTTWS